MKSLRFIRLRGVNIFEQLCFEEQILRTTKENCFIFNIGSNATNVVLGYSGKPSELINIENAKRDKIEVLRRYTGGGTVVVDKNTIFTSFIMNVDDVPCKPFPRNIMNWSESFFAPVFQSLLTGSGTSNSSSRQSSSEHHVDTDVKFKLREHDYVFGDKKFGGNAQSITKDRWVHHTSFLWDFDPLNMEYLQVPKRRPEYRGDRSHLDFITRLCTHVDSVSAMEDAIYNELSKTYNITHDVQLEGDDFRRYKEELETIKGSFTPRSIIEELN